mgnify:FL=1
MEIRKIDGDKKRFLPLLLLGDEQESMIDRYLESSDMFAMFDRRNAPIAIAVVSKKAHGQYELMNLAVAPCHQRKGHGSQMIEFICNRYKDFAISHDAAIFLLHLLYLVPKLVPLHKIKKLEWVLKKS